MFQTKRTKLKKSITSKLHYNKTTIQRNSSKKQSKTTTREKNSQESAQETNLSKPKASTYLTSKESVSSLNEHLINTTSKATFHTQTTLRNLLSKPKDPIPKEDRNNAVYQLNCKDCEAIYVGETKQTLNIRGEEHITVIKSASKGVTLVTLQSTTGNTIVTLTRNIRKYWALRKTGKQELSRKQSTQKKMSIISTEYPSNYQIFGNQESKAKKTNAKTTISPN